MNRIALVIGGGVIAAASFFGVSFAHEGAHEEAEGKTTTVIGELIDTACFTASDGDAKGMDHAECAAKCLATGIPAGILPEGSTDAKAMMFLLTNPKPFAAHAGKTIHVEGTVYADLHAIDVKKAHVVDADGKMTEIKLDDEHHKMGGNDEKKMDDMKGMEKKGHDMKGMDDAHKDHKN